MSDDSLRALARAVEASGSGTVRLRYARALERAGRAEDAFDVLVGARQDPEVRAELARFPTWSQRDADAGRTRFLDAAPIRRTPALRWISTEAAAPELQFLVSPFGVAFLGQHGDTVVLDPETGALRRRIALVEPCAFAGDVLLVKWNTKLRGYDLESGAVIHETTTGQLSFEAHVAGDVLLAASPSAVRAYQVADPREEPVFLWEYATRRTNRKGRFERVAVAGGSVLVPHNGDVFVLDLRSGARGTRFQGSSVRADGRGSLVRDERKFAPESSLVARGLDGRILWKREGPGFLALALAPDVAVVHVPRSGPSLLDRATGRVLRRLSEDRCDVVLCVRDVVYVLRAGVPDERDDRLSAFSTKGEPLWETSLGVVERPVVALAAGSRRIYGVTKGGSVFCFGEAEEGR